MYVKAFDERVSLDHPVGVFGLMVSLIGKFIGLPR